MEPIEMTMEQLEARPYSYSSGKHFRKSPKHFISYRTKKRTPATPEMILGKGFELKLYSHVFKKPEMFDGGIFPYTKPNLKSNAGKEEWEQLKKAAGGKLMLAEDQLTTIKNMMESTLSCDEIMRYVNSIKKEQIELRWKDKKTGIPCIGYADAEGDAFGNNWCFEIKTAGDADPDEFLKAAYRFDYHMQIAAYSNGYRFSKYKFPDFAFLVFETKEPYNTAPIMVESKTLQQWNDEWSATLDAFKFCMDEQLFHQGYEFRLQTKPYFSMRKPGYYKPKFMMDEG